MAVEPFDVAFVNVRRVWQHDAAKVARGRCGEDVAAEAAFAEVWEVAAVVDVRVGKHHDVDLRRIKGEITVALEGLVPPSLIKATVEQDALTVDLDEMLRAGGGACGTAEGEFHGWLEGNPVAPQLVTGTPNTATGLLGRFRSSVQRFREPPSSVID